MEFQCVIITSLFLFSGYSLKTGQLFHSFAIIMPVWRSRLYLVDIKKRLCQDYAHNFTPTLDRSHLFRSFTVYVCKYGYRETLITFSNSFPSVTFFVQVSKAPSESIGRVCVKIRMQIGPFSSDPSDPFENFTEIL
jgi:hypothetical protein